MEAEQHAAEQSTNHRRNQKRNQNMHRNKWKWKYDSPKPMGFSKSNAKRELYSNTSLPQEIRETLNNQPNFTPKATIEGRTEKPQS